MSRNYFLPWGAAGHDHDLKIHVALMKIKSKIWWMSGNSAAVIVISTRPTEFEINSETWV